ncbi:MAG TPA: phosphatidate cytidylyltransferase [Solirubrobacteraceae bacterium]|nr:phosphatidate cytidylyltransferase [Solirubrobacteraceae bacterium]
MPASRGGRGAQGRSPGQGSDLLRRILVAIPAAVVAVLFIDLGGLAFALFMIAVGWACLHELYRMLARWHPVAIVGFASVAAMVLSARHGGERDIVLVAAATVPVLFLFVAGRGQGRHSVAIAGTLLGVYWIGMAVTLAVLLRQLPHGKGVLIDVLLGTFLGDTAAYLGGRMFGRRLLAPTISPRKTVEGLLIGSLTAVVTVLLARLFQENWLTQGHALLLGVTVAVFAPLGDLFESVIKRDAGAKDTGRAFGPHGGVLDRADAALFTMSAAYFVWLAVGS